MRARQLEMHQLSMSCTRSRLPHQTLTLLVPLFALPESQPLTLNPLLALLVALRLALVQCYRYLPLSRSK